MTEKLTEYQNRLISETLCKMVLDGVAPDEIRKKQRFLSEQMTKLNAQSFSENLCSATVAIEDGESVSDASPKLSLQNGLEPPSHHNAWGALASKAAKAGVIEWTGEYILATSARTHGHPVKIWRRS